KRIGYAGAGPEALMRSGCARLAAANVILASISGAAWAGQAAGACWIQNGVLLVPAIAGGVNGVFILDTGQARSQLDATQASEADIAADTATTDVRLAGRVAPSIRMQVLALDDRTRAFAVPIAGVLGADVLAGRTLEVQPDPCRVRLSQPGRAPAHRSGVVLPLQIKDGAPYIRAAVSDGMTGVAGEFRVDTGSPVSVTLGAASAALAREGRLRGLSIGGLLIESAPTKAAQDTPEGVLGRIGEPIWSRFAVRLDYAGQTLGLSAPRRARSRGSSHR
ncbi:MAG TPA: hypothetical protein VHY34_08990, partial [Caulobacteraceae bacterium]|nr:hypothetical protein [Caulobacteraceae bacterium]